MVGQRVLHQIGQTGIPVVNCANACATGATAFREGWMAIRPASTTRCSPSASRRWAAACSAAGAGAAGFRRRACSAR